MVGQTWPAEERSSRDERTGRHVRQLTTRGNNYHLYFTDCAFTRGHNEVIFSSDRAGEPRAPQEDPHYNLFRLDLDSGAITQLTDEPLPISRATKTPDSSIICYITGDSIKKLDARSGVVSTLYEDAGTHTLGAPFISPDGRYVGFTRNERAVVARGVDYAGFKERFYQIKDGRIALAALDGSGWFDVLCDTHELGHFQFSPDNPSIAMFCHEGPWHLVKQRMWGLDLISRHVWPLFRQGEQDSVGHEFWTQDGLIFFDNRGPGHDGTITSRRTQAVAPDEAPQGDFRPYVGLVDRWGQVVRTVELPFYCNHYHASPDNALLVGDAVDELVLIDIGGQRGRLEVLCQHGTSWHTQASHCHPTWSWDGTRILYASDRGGRVNLYMVEL